MTTMVGDSQFHPGNKIGWRSAVSTALALTIAIAVVALVLGLALVLIPIIAVGVLIATWRLRAFRTALARALEGRGRRWDHEAPRTIEADYTITQGSGRKSP